ncbi:hypothetical protein [Streptomyces sp. NPDC057939]|uniref:hypothetical protein n=1 Tax=Streptomyces sp. NPDC057939 TaxID=3346284 RepID=UPI0036EDB81F
MERLRTPAAAFLRPELEERLARHVEAGDPLARDQMARVLAGACGPEALPTLLHAMVGDGDEEGGTLELDVLALFRARPDTALRLVLDCVTAVDPGARLVVLRDLSVIDFGGTAVRARSPKRPSPRIRGFAPT